MEKAKKRSFIYLAGNISKDPKTYEWRDKFTNLLIDDSRVVVVNPCKNEFDQGMKGLGTTGLDFAIEASKRSQKILRAKDYQLIKMCSVLVVNLEIYNKDHPMIGTIQELTWARDIFYVPVIAICGTEPNIYTEHPWVDECCSAKVETVEEAAEMIKTFFLEY